MSVDTTNLTSLNVANSTATSTAGAATSNAQTGVITTEALTTGAFQTYTMTLTNSYINANSIVLAKVGKGSATAGQPVVQYVTEGAGTAVILITNFSSTVAVNGTLKIAFKVENVA